MSELLEIAIQAALSGGEAIMKVYGTTFEVEIKEDNSPLTLADQNANTLINQFLLPTDIPIISEENKQLDYSERKDWNRCWVVDPLDGTKEFVKRNGEFTVNIALVENENPILGVIYVPVTKTLYYADLDQKGAYKIELDDVNTPVATLSDRAVQMKPATPGSPLKIVGSRSHLNEDTKAFISSYEESQAVEIVSKGSSLKFCMVAEGIAHLYPRFAPTMEWDTAAGQAICMAVGLKVIDQSTGSPLRYNKQNLLNPYFLVTP